jgi:hypothetical protein
MIGLRAGISNFELSDWSTWRNRYITASYYLGARIGLALTLTVNFFFFFFKDRRPVPCADISAPNNTTPPNATHQFKERSLPPA